MELNQYEIIQVNLDPTIGSEIKKSRPCVIISPNEMNKYIKTIVIAPITSSSKAYPTRFEINHKKIKGWVVLDQVRTIDKIRVTKKHGTLIEEDIVKLKSILYETYVL